MRRSPRPWIERALGAALPFGALTALLVGAISGPRPAGRSPFVAPSGERVPAEAAAPADVPACAEDLLRGEALERWIARLEGAVAAKLPPAAGERRKFGRWELARLSAGDRWILGAHADAFDPELVAMAGPGGCADLACVLRAAYGGEALPARQAYAFMLATRYRISFSTKLPKFAPVPASRAAFLYTPAEVEAFLRSRTTLPEIFWTLPRLGGFHRFPDEYGFDGQTCGLARSASVTQWFQPQPDGTQKWVKNEVKEIGSILFSKPCLTLSPAARGPRLQDFFYSSVAHELGHHLDYAVWPEADRWSDRADWLGFSGWSKDEVVDPATGKAEAAWKVSAKGEGFVSDYAGTSPIEDLAESIAFWRYSPERFEVAPRKGAFVAKQFFGGRAYGVEARLERWSDLVDQELAAVPEASVAESLEASLARRGVEDHEFCAWRRDPAGGFAAWREERATRARLAAERGAAQASRGAAAARAGERLRARLNTSADPVVAFLGCWQLAAGVGRDRCYEAELRKQFAAAAAEAGRGDAEEGDWQALGRQELAFFLRERTWAEASRRAQLQASTWLEPLREPTLAWARDHWAACVGRVGARSAWAIAPGTPARTMVPFGGGLSYVDAELMDCVNRLWTRAWETLAARHRPDLAQASESARAFARGIAERPVVDAWERLAAAAREDERRRILAAERSAAASIRASAVTARVITATATGSACVARLQPWLEADFSRSGEPAALSLLFSSPLDVARRRAQLACSRR